MKCEEGAHQVAVEAKAGHNHRVVVAIMLRDKYNLDLNFAGLLYNDNLTLITIYILKQLGAVLMKDADMLMPELTLCSINLFIIHIFLFSMQNNYSIIPGM